MADLRSAMASLMYGAAGSYLRLRPLSYRIGIEAMTSSANRPKREASLDDPEQSKRFLEAAREAEADESEKGADKAFRKVAAKPKPKSASKGR